METAAPAIWLLLIAFWQPGELKPVVTQGLSY